MKNNKFIVDVDGNWKAFIHHFFRKFVRYCLKDLYELTDWSRGYEPLEQELWNFIEKKPKGSKKVDKLYKVWLKDGTEQWVLIHTEVQHDANSDINLRMLEYFMHLHLKHHVPVASLVLFTGKTIPKNAGLIQLGLGETELTYKFPFLHIYEQPEAQLLANKDVLSLAFLAHKAMLETTESDEKRLEWKKKIVLWSEELEEDFEKILNFVVGILPLDGEKMRDFRTFFKNNLEMGKVKEPKFTGTREALNLIFSLDHDITFDEYEKQLKTQAKRADVEAKRAEHAEIIKAERERALKLMETENARINAEKEHAETEKKRVETEKKQAEAEKLRQFEHNVMKLRYQKNMDIEEIAEFVEADLPQIEAILKKYDTEKERFVKKK